MTVWCEGFLKAHAALWKPAVRWALSAGGVKSGLCGSALVTFSKDKFRCPSGHRRARAVVSAMAILLIQARIAV